MTVKLLAEHRLEFLNLTGGCRGSSESTLVKMPHCWKSHVAAQLCVKGSDGMGNSVNPDQTAPLSELGSNCLLRHIWTHTVCSGISGPILFTQAYLGSYSLLRHLLAHTLYLGISGLILFALAYLGSYSLLRHIWAHTLCTGISGFTLFTVIAQAYLDSFCSLRHIWIHTIYHNCSGISGLILFNQVYLDSHYLP